MKKIRVIKKNKWGELKFLYILIDSFIIFFAIIGIVSIIVTTLKDILKWKLSEDNNEGYI